MQRIYTRVVVGDEFYDLMKDAGVTRNELIRLTGLTGIDIDRIIKGSSDKRPRMSDLVLLSLLREKPGLKSVLLAISDTYHEGEIGTSTTRFENRAKQFGREQSND